MALYRYVKAYPKRYRHPGRSLGVSFLLMSVGVGILLWTMWPILSFQLSTAGIFAKTISPIQDRVATLRNTDVSAPVVLAAGTGQTDYTNANIWFPTRPQKKVATPVNTYLLSIPKLKIDKALVTIAGYDLNKSLIHYGGTGLPGDFGNTVIFGHSTLPQFYNPKNYKTIFSTLPTLRVGDELFLEYDGVVFRFVIFEMVVTKPNDLSPLEQHFDDSYLTLITCVPPGTYWERLNVKAKLTPLL